MDTSDWVHAERRPAGAWMDDVAVIVAAWLDRRPVVHRTLIALVIVLAGRVLIVQSSFCMAALALLLLPRLPRLRGSIGTGTGVLLAVAGTVRIVATERTWLTFPTEDGLGITLLTLGLFLAARRGRWLPWLACGAATGVVLSPRFGTTGFLLTATPVFGVAALVLVARVSAVPRPAPDTDAARTRLVVGLQAHPWATSFAVCALPVAGMAPTWLPGTPGVTIALVAVLFHATWRAPALFDKAASWTAALLMPSVAFVVLWWLPAQSSGSALGFGPGRSAWDFAVTPWVALPLLAGVLIGRRPPGRRCTLLDAALLVLAVLAPAAVIALLRGAVRTSYPAMYAVALEHPVLWTTAGALWLLPFHRLVATDVPARRIVVGAGVAGAVQLGTLLWATADDDAAVTIGRGALAPVVSWAGVALLLLLARDVARATRVPDDHPVVADFHTVPRDA